MSLHLHIDRLVLEGTSLTPRDGARLEASLGVALAQLFESRGLHPDLAKGIALPHLTTAPMSLPSTAGPAAMGLQIAQHLAVPLLGQART